MALKKKDLDSFTGIHSSQVLVVLQQVFSLIQIILSKWLHDSEVVEVGGYICMNIYNYFFLPVLV